MIRACLRNALLLCSLCLLPAEQAFAQLAVIVNAKSGVSVLTKNDVMNIFLGRYRQLATGIEARPIDMVDSHPDRARFYRLLVGKEVPEINAYWARLIFSGRVNPPVQANTAEDVIKWVQANPGGIGFVDMSRVDGRVRVVLEMVQ